MSPGTHGLIGSVDVGSRDAQDKPGVIVDRKPNEIGARPSQPTLWARTQAGNVTVGPLIGEVTVMSGLELDVGVALAQTGIPMLRRRSANSFFILYFLNRVV